MKIGMPYDNGSVNKHFGKSEAFVILELAGDEVTAKEVISTTALKHNHTGITGMLREKGVEVIIAGGIGSGMINALQAAGFPVISGIEGNVEAAAKSYVNGALAAGEATCNCGGDHHHQH